VKAIILFTHNAEPCTVLDRMTGGTQAVHCSDFELAGSEHLNGSPFSNHI